MTKLRLNEFLGRVEKIQKYYKWRYGQALFNALVDLRPDIADEIRGTPLDPFEKKKQSDVPAGLWTLLEERWLVGPSRTPAE